MFSLYLLLVVAMPPTLILVALKNQPRLNLYPVLFPFAACLPMST
jgi:hypothetical protein